MKKIIIISPVFLLAIVGLIYFNMDKTSKAGNTHLRSSEPSVAAIETVKSTEVSKILDAVPENKNTEAFKGENQIGRQAVSLAVLEERYRNASNNDRYPTLSSRVSEINERRPSANISPEDVVEAVEKSEAWETREDPGVVAQKLSERELNDGRAFIEFDPVKVETLMPGDYMDIDIDVIGRVLEMKVENVDVFSDGNIVWQGKIVNQDGTDAENGTVNITQSSKVTVASIVLHDKDYVLESYGTDGWVSNAGALFTIDPNDDH